MTFQVGDVVTLRSGGPAMTVRSVGKKLVRRQQKIYCVWFNKVKKVDAGFDFETLEAAENCFGK
jgi:uncharacterized protein YodC (DUF2158 family)